MNPHAWTKTTIGGQVIYTRDLRGYKLTLSTKEWGKDYHIYALRIYSPEINTSNEFTKTQIVIEFKEANWKTACKKAIKAVSRELEILSLSM